MLIPIRGRCSLIQCDNTQMWGGGGTHPGALSDQWGLYLLDCVFQGKPHEFPVISVLITVMKVS